MAGLNESNQIGKREDLSDVISVVDARATPITSMMPKGRDACDTLYQWQVDSFAENDTDGVVDGKDAEAFNQQSDRQKLGGRIQKKWRNPMVTDMAQNVTDPAGIGKKKEFQKETALAIINLKRDMECVFGSDNDSVDGNSSTAYKTRGLGSWISNGAQADTPTVVPTDFRTPTGSIDTTAVGSLTETEVQDVLESMWDECGTLKTYAMILGATLKRRFSSFGQFQDGVSATKAALRTFNQDGNSKQIVATIDFYGGDFGELELHPSTFLAHGTAHGKRRGYVLDMALTELRFNRAPGFRPLEDQGGGPRGIVDCIFSMAVKNPLGLAKFAATS